MTERSPSVPPAPPEAWTAGRSAARRVLAPVERFLHIEAASGVVLMLAAVIAIAWANSPYRASYEHLWHTELSLGFGAHVLRASLHFVINDMLMVVFFFVVGLEIRREIHDGELSQPSRAALPVAAALGGMVLPAAVFLALNTTGEARRGWGVPMATDIAFAVGVLALLGKRVPAALRILLLALAIIDDIGAILVIAIFYSTSINVWGFVVAGGAIGVVLLMQRLGVRHALLYVPVGAVVWAGILRGGVHPTIAGVILGLLTPARAWYGSSGFVKRSEAALEKIRALPGGPDEILEPLDAIGRARREAVAPVVRLQWALHVPVAFVIMPLFALANAGVPVVGGSFAGADGRLIAGVVLGLALGKPAGIIGAALLAVRLRIARLPARVSFGGVAVVGCVAGIGFTMALFVSELAFAASSLLATAKLAVLIGSGLSAVVALVVGRVALDRVDEDVSETVAERCTDA